MENRSEQLEFEQTVIIFGAYPGRSLLADGGFSRGLGMIESGRLSMGNIGCQVINEDSHNPQTGTGTLRSDTDEWFEATMTKAV